MNWPEIQTIGIIIVGIGYLIAQFRKGSNSSYSETIAILTARDEAQKQLIVDYQSKFDTINKELGVLQGQLKEKDTKIQEYLTILQGRDPELLSYIKDVSARAVKIEGLVDSMNIRLGDVEVRNRTKDAVKVA